MITIIIPSPHRKGFAGDINTSRKEGKRVESFVPYAKQIKETIGGDFTLREALIFAEKDFEKEINKRFLNMISTKGDD